MTQSPNSASANPAGFEEADAVDAHRQRRVRSASATAGTEYTRNGTGRWRPRARGVRSQGDRTPLTSAHHTRVSLETPLTYSLSYPSG